LNRIVVMFLDYAEDQARRRKQIFLRDWQSRLDDFLRFNERAVLPDAGKTTRDEAHHHAREEYEQFEERRRMSAESQGETALMEQLEETARNMERVKTARAPSAKK
jgi:hypothetical protein